MRKAKHLFVWGLSTFDAFLFVTSQFLCVFCFVIDLAKLINGCYAGCQWFIYDWRRALQNSVSKALVGLAVSSFTFLQCSLLNAIFGRLTSFYQNGGEVVRNFLSFGKMNAVCCDNSYCNCRWNPPYRRSHAWIEHLWRIWLESLSLFRNCFYISYLALLKEFVICSSNLKQQQRHEHVFLSLKINKNNLHYFSWQTVD